MALQTSGAISLGDIAAEYGGSAPHALSEYRGKGNAPGTGAIRLGADFYGTSNTFSFTISTTQVDANLRSLAVAAGWDQTTAVIATIGSGVNINGSVAANSTAALTIDGSWPGGVTLINNGSITGRGGSGSVSATNGGAGGRALSVSVAVTIDNQGTIAGGGGGGAGGWPANYSSSCEMGESSSSCSAPGGGGGGGQSNTSYNGLAGGASTASGSSCWYYYDSITGTAGTSSAAGTGGAGGSCESCICTGNHTAQTGGAGGSLGSAGSNTTSRVGGAAGQAVNGNSNITWTATGTRLGPIV